MKIKTLLVGMVLSTLSLPAVSVEFTDGYRTVTKLYLYQDTHTHFYLDEACPQEKKYYSLYSDRVDINRYYSTIMAAFMAGKKVLVAYELDDRYCDVTRITIQ